MNEARAPSAFSDAECDILRRHGIVLWGGRVVFDAQPPMDDAAIAAVQAQCAGPIPSPLLSLWKTTAGGRLDYDLTVSMEGQQEAISFTELFYDGSNGYHDLAGWIEHERELAEEAAAEDGRPFDGRLTWLPIGGFEYLNRVYVCTLEGPEHGEVLAWKQGLPPAWRHRLHVDAVATVAPDLEAAFARLKLFVDPLQPDDEFFTGSELLEYLQERVESHGLPQALSDRLIDRYRDAMLDWRSALASGGLGGDPDMANSALNAAISADDADLLRQAMAQGVLVDVPLAGSATPLEQAVVQSAWRVLQVLLDHGAPVAKDVFLEVTGPMPGPLAETLLAAGAEPLPAAVANLVALAADDAADVLIVALRAHPRVGRSVASARLEVQSLQGALRTDLKQVKSGRLSHWLGETGLRTRIERLQAWLDNPAHQA